MELKPQKGEQCEIRLLSNRGTKCNFAFADGRCKGKRHLQCTIPNYTAWWQYNFSHLEALSLQIPAT